MLHFPLVLMNRLNNTESVVFLGPIHMHTFTYVSKDILMSNENAPPTKMTISFYRHKILFSQLRLIVL